MKVLKAVLRFLTGADLDAGTWGAILQEKQQHQDQMMAVTLAELEDAPVDDSVPGTGANYVDAAVWDPSACDHGEGL